MEGAAQLVSTVGQLVGEEYRQLRSVGSQVAELRDELATMNAILRMQSEAEDGAVDHFVREWMKQVRELAYDAEDCVDLYVFRIRCGSRRGRFLAWSTRLLATLFPRRQLAGEIEALRARAIAISERNARYGVRRKALPRSPSLAPAPLATGASRPADPRANDYRQFVLQVMKNEIDTLAERVKAMDNNDPDNKLKVFSIIGFGGLGKTTLAMEVRRKLETEFQCHALVSVSQTFDGKEDLKGLLKQVLRQVVKTKADADKKEEQVSDSDIDKMDVDDLASTLNHALKDKRYLIVIDDVWTIAAWNAIQSKLPDNNCGSRILVTTRIETVAKECCGAGVDHICHIKPLQFEDAKKLFLERVFGSTNENSCPTELKDEMFNILRKCGGLPLAIVSVASLLANKSSHSRDMWEIIGRSIGFQMETNPTLEGMKQIVTLSYNHLPHHLKSCMMYLSIFPEDYVINRDRLLYRWIAEGLVEEKRGLTLIEVAKTYFDELVSRMMIAPKGDVSYDGRVKHCHVHDMMLEVMVSKSLEANFVSLLGGQYKKMSYDRIRRLSIHGGGQGKNSSSSKKKAKARGIGSVGDIEGMSMKHVRSLSMFDLEGHRLLDRLDEFALLRMLDLEDCKGLENKHMGDICRMYLLRFLSLRNTNISVMPPEIGELEHLQTLDVGNTLLDDLPDTVTELEKLERVNFRKKNPHWDTMWTPRPGLVRMKALREVNYMIINDVEVAKEIGEFGQLQELGIYLPGSQDPKQKRRVGTSPSFPQWKRKIQSQDPKQKWRVGTSPSFPQWKRKIQSSEPHEYDEYILRQLALSLNKTYSLRTLSIVGRSGQGATLNFLLQLDTPPRLLRYLYIDGSIDKLPSWFGSLAYLAEIYILWAELLGDDLFDVLCKLPNLHIIGLGPGSYTGTELVARSRQIFLALKILYVQTKGQLPIIFEKGSMSKLETLHVNFSNTEKSIVGIEHLTNLKEVVLYAQESNSTLHRALEKLKDESRRHNQFKVTVRYY